MRNLVEEQDEVNCECHKQGQHPKVVKITSQIVLETKKSHYKHLKTLTFENRTLFIQQVVNIWIQFILIHLNALY